MAWTIQSREAIVFTGVDPQPLDITIPKGCAWVTLTDFDGKPLGGFRVGPPRDATAIDFAVKEISSVATRRMAELLDGLFAAFAQTHPRIERISRYDDYGRLCQYPAAGDWAARVTPEMLTLAADLAPSYFAACAIPPEECMVVSWLDGTAWRTEYERRPEAWI